MVKVIEVINNNNFAMRPVSPRIFHKLTDKMIICFLFVFFFQPVFDALKQHVQSLFVGELVPVKDRCTLTEALVIAR